MNTDSQIPFRTKLLPVFSVLCFLLVMQGSNLFAQSFWPFQRSEHKTKIRKTDSLKKANSPWAAVTSVPEKAISVFKYVKVHRQAPEGYVGGRRFGNYEGRLPVLDSAGNKILYQEWDVNPHLKGVNRGAERLITGSSDQAWYTPDHYQTFIKLQSAY